MQTGTIRDSAGSLCTLEVPSAELVPLIRELLEQGRNVRMTVKGQSMVPFIRSGDTVELSPLGARGLQVGRIYLAELSRSRYALHRLVAVTPDGMAVFQGDGNPSPDPSVPLSSVVAGLSRVIRDGRELDANSSLWRFLGRAWCATRPVGLRFVALQKKGRRIARRILQCVGALPGSSNS